MESRRAGASRRGGASSSGQELVRNRPAPQSPIVGSVEGVGGHGAAAMHSQNIPPLSAGSMPGADERDDTDIPLLRLEQVASGPGTTDGIVVDARLTSSAPGGAAVARCDGLKGAVGATLEPGVEPKEPAGTEVLAVELQGDTRGAAGAAGAG